MPLWRKKKEEPEESQAERLRKFRSMYATQYGTSPNKPEAVQLVGEPVKVQTLCIICSEPMEGPEGDQVCPAAQVEPELHDRLRVALQNWRTGQVQGKTVVHYNKTILLMRQALQHAMDRHRAESEGVAPGVEANPAAPAGSGLPPGRPPS